MDGLRTFAIGLVVLWHLRIAILDTAAQPLLHTRGPLSWVVDKGWFGVQLFFAISGFILALPFARAHLHKKPPPRLGDYYLRRLTRLEPPYILTLVLLLFVRAYARDVTVRSLLPNLAASLLYVHNIVFDDVSSISGVAWSLEVEVQFYLLAPLLSAIFAVRSRVVRRGLFVGVALVSVAAQIAVEARYGFHFRWAGTLPAQIQYFMIGMLLADLWVSDWHSKCSPTPWWDLGALAGLCLLGVSLHAPEIGYRLGVLPAIFLLYAGALRGRLFQSLLRRPLLSTLGGMCYSTYLLHTTVIYLFYPALKSAAIPASYPLRFALFLVPVTLSVIASSALFFVLVERPCMERDWPSRLLAAVKRRMRRDPVGHLDGHRSKMWSRPRRHPSGRSRSVRRINPRGSSSSRLRRRGSRRSGCNTRRRRCMWRRCLCTGLRRRLRCRRCSTRPLRPGRCNSRSL